MTEPVRLGLIGAGRWGQVYMRTLAGLSDRCRLTHVASSQPRAHDICPPGTIVNTDWRRLIQGDCDAVIIATPPAVHAEMVDACVAARKPCIVEKPLCLDSETAEALHRRVEASGSLVLVDHTHLFHPAYAALKRALAQAGEPIRAVSGEGMGFGPFRPDVPALWDWGPHDVSLCLDLLGAVPERVDAVGGPDGPDGEPELVTARLEFFSGAQAWFYVSRMAPAKRRTLTVVTDASLYWLDEYSPDPLRVTPLSRPAASAPAGPGWTSLPVESDVPPMTAMVSYFLDGLQGGDRQRFGTSLARDVVRVLSLCQAALERGRTAPGLDA
jgi:predicted dehydrogenase